LEHIKLEELSLQVEKELERRWRQYEQDPELFQPFVQTWSQKRLEQFITTLMLEAAYGGKEKPGHMLAVAKRELERRDPEALANLEY